MNPVLLAAGLFAIVAGLWSRRAQAEQGAQASSPWPTFDLELLPATDASGDAGQETFVSAAFSDFQESPAMPQQNPQQETTNVRAFLAMIRAAEGTAGEGGYNALFGWPAIAGRTFDAYSVSGHPKQFFDYTDKAGKTIKTSAAGAYQITYTTWTSYYLRFRAWASLNGYSGSGFTPETQDAFAIYLLDLDGALPLIKAGRVADALLIARRRWASLPGAGYNQPERTQQYVINAYTNAGGAIA